MIMNKENSYFDNIREANRAFGSLDEQLHDIKLKFDELESDIHTNMSELCSIVSEFRDAIDNVENTLREEIRQLKQQVNKLSRSITYKQLS